MKKIFIVAGELSGDRLGAWYIKHLKQQSLDVEFHSVGGDFLRQAGAKIYEKFENLNVVGFVEILKKLPFIFRFLKQLSSYILQNNFDQVILVDFPGFNLRLAKKLKSLNPKISITYVSPPQTWVWGGWRIKKLKKYCDKLIVLYPFEVEWYKKHGVKVDFIGNPVYEELVEFMVRDSHKMASSPQTVLGKDREPLKTSSFQKNHVKKVISNGNFINTEHSLEEIGKSNEPFVVRSEASRIHEHPKTNQIAIIPGSRVSEIKTLFPLFAGIIKLFKKKYPELKIVLPLAQSISLELIEAKIKDFGLSNFRKGIKIIFGEKEKFEELSKCCLAITKPGTVSLELALLQVPAVVFYKTSWITYFLARTLVKVKYMALPNLLLDKLVYQEIIQWNCNAASIFNFADNMYKNFLAQKKEYFECLQELQQLQKLLGTSLSDTK